MIINIHVLRDKKVITRLYDTLLPKITEMIVTNGGSEEESEDIFQDALVVLYNKATVNEFSISCKLETFVYGICKKLWLVRLRRKRTENKYLTDVYIETEDISIENELSIVEKEALYETYFNLLGEQCKQLLILFYQKRSFKEIARKMGFGSEGYAKKAKFNCKKKLITSIQNDPLFKELKI